MMKKFLSLTLALVLCLGLAVPALAAENIKGTAEPPYTFEDDWVSITNVIKQETIDGDVEGYYVKDALSCAAPVHIAPMGNNSGEYWYLVQVYRFPEGSETVEAYIPESETAEVPEPGRYYVVVSRSSENDGDYTGYLLTINGEAVKPTTARFTDVPSDAYYAEAVAWAVEQGITDGTSSTTFSPDQTCTRAQIITFLWRAAGSPEPQNVSAFSDVKTDTYYAKAAAWAKENGMTGGDTFSPEDPCTRIMAVKFMWKHAGSPDAAAASFSDVSSPAVDWAVDQGVTNGTSDTTFSPNATCTRGQIVTFLYRGFAEQNSGQNPEEGQPVTDVTKMIGTYQNAENPKYEMVVDFYSPRIIIELHNTKYGTTLARGYLTVVNNCAFSDGIRMYFYSDYLTVEFTGDMQGAAHTAGKYIKISD